MPGVYRRATGHVHEMIGATLERGAARHRATGASTAGPTTACTPTPPPGVDSRPRVRPQGGRARQAPRRHVGPVPRGQRRGTTSPTLRPRAHRGRRRPPPRAARHRRRAPRDARRRRPPRPRRAAPRSEAASTRSSRSSWRRSTRRSTSAAGTTSARSRPAAAPTSSSSRTSRDLRAAPSCSPTAAGRPDRRASARSTRRREFRRLGPPAARAHRRRPAHRRAGRRDTAAVRAIGMVPGELATEHRVVEAPVIDGEVRGVAGPATSPRPASIERHGGPGTIGLGFVQGLGLQRGAVATTVAHDNHNLLRRRHERRGHALRRRAPREAAAAA